MPFWLWLERQDIPGFAIGTWLAGTPAALWLHLVTKRRHKERIAAQDRLTAAILTTKETP